MPPGNALIYSPSLALEMFCVYFVLVKGLALRALEGGTLSVVAAQIGFMQAPAYWENTNFCFPTSQPAARLKLYLAFMSLILQCVAPV